MTQIKTMVNHFAVLVLAAAVVSPSAARAQACILRWDPQFDTSGFQSSISQGPSIRALQVHDADSGPRLFVGGQFTQGGETARQQIVQWDGITWSDVGGGLSRDSSLGDVLALGSWNNRLFAGGSFTRAGSAEVSRIAEWNGVTWSDVGGGTNTTVLALAAAEDVLAGPGLFVGGAFNNAGSTQNVNGIARWNGVTWSRLGGGLRAVDGTVGSVFALLPSDGRLYVGGGFEIGFNGPGATNPVPLNFVAQWDGAAWSALAGGMSGTPQTIVHALAAYDGKLIAGGTFTAAGGVPANNIASWDGAAWSPLGAGTGGVSINLSSVWALTTWDDGQGGGPALYAGGYFDSAGGVPCNHVARWDGMTWSALSGGVSQTGSGIPAVYALGSFDVPSAALFVGGVFKTADGWPANSLARWSCVSPDACGSVVRGDFNGDGMVSGLDLSGFVDQLTSPPPAGSPDFCRANLVRGDVPEVLNEADAAALIACLLDAGQCP